MDQNISDLNIHDLNLPSASLAKLIKDEDEVEYEYPKAYAQLDSAATFGVLFILDDDCISKEEFA